MNGRLGLLGVILLVQLAIIAVFVLYGRGDESASTKLLDFDPVAVDRVVIAEQKDTLELVRKDGKWLAGAVPVDAAKADKLVSDFANFASPWPVSTTTSSTERFEVTPAKFQRRVTFYKGEETAGDVWLGTSPGFQRVHARREGSDSVYSISFSNFQASVKVDDWLDKAILAADGAVKRVVSPTGFKLERGAEGWLLDGVAANQDKATSYAERFENLRVLGVADPKADGTDKGGFTVADGEGEYTLQLKEGRDESEYVLTSSRKEGTFRLAAYIAEQLLEDREKLLTKPDDEASLSDPLEAPGIPAGTSTDLVVDPAKSAKPE